MDLTSNEIRASRGQAAVSHGAHLQNAYVYESTRTAIKDVLADIAHFCDRCGLMPEELVEAAFNVYYGDFEDGPLAKATLDASLPLADHGPTCARASSSD